MASSRDILLAAIDRWRAAGLLTPEAADRLRTDVKDTTERERTRWSQFILAATAAIVSLTAAGVFLGWAWPAMEAGARASVLGGVGLALKALGVGLERRDRWVPASYLMQTAGLSIVLVAVAYSEEAWPDASAGAVVIGVAGLAIPLVTAWTAIRRNPVMPAVHVALGYAFFGLFLSRAFALAADDIIWVLDGILLLSVGVLLRMVRRDEGRDPGSEWALNAFAASVYAGLVLVFLTATGPLDLSDDAVFALDLWWLVVVTITLWAVHRAPPALQRSWYETQLGWCIVLGTLFAFGSAAALDLPDFVTAAAVGAFGFLWLVYGVPRRSRPVIVTSCLALVAAAWFLGVQEGGALGAVLALGFTAALLFWVSARLAGREASG